MKTILSAVLLSGLGICLLHSEQFLNQGGIADNTILADGIAQFRARKNCVPNVVCKAVSSSRIKYLLILLHLAETDIR